jgi:ABC-type dipeptide/oligopeptide/nickel transport system permease component
MGVATIAGFLNLFGLLLADLAYAAVDPRISFEAVE